MGTLSIDIVLDKAGYYSGEELSGKLVLANQPDKPEVPVNNVIVKLNGVIGIGQMNKSSNSKQESHRQTQQIVLLKLDLPVPEGKVESGQKVIIPFEFMLPEQ